MQRKPNTLAALCEWSSEHWKKAGWSNLLASSSIPAVRTSEKNSGLGGAQCSNGHSWMPTLSSLWMVMNEHLRRSGCIIADDGQNTSMSSIGVRTQVAESASNVSCETKCGQSWMSICRHSINFCDLQYLAETNVSRNAR